MREYIVLVRIMLDSILSMWYNVDTQKVLAFRLLPSVALSSDTVKALSVYHNLQFYERISYN